MANSAKSINKSKFSVNFFSPSSNNFSISSYNFNLSYTLTASIHPLGSLGNFSRTMAQRSIACDHSLRFMADSAKSINKSALSGKVTKAFCITFSILSYSSNLLHTATNSIKYS